METSEFLYFGLIISIMIIGGGYYTLFVYEYQYENMVAPEGVFDDPYQKNLIDQESLKLDGFDLIPLAEYEIKARVVSTQKYKDYLDISPIDFAVVWGTLANSSYLNSISFAQRDRFVHTKIPRSLSPSSFDPYMSNIHIIPANSVIKKIVMDVNKGDFVSMKGYLVEVKVGEHQVSKSSLSRNDLGDGACEVLYVESIELIG